MKGIIITYFNKKIEYKTLSKYPNLLAEIYYSMPAPYITVAENANITPELFLQILKGESKEELAGSEAGAIFNTYRKNICCPKHNPDYIFSSHLAFYNMSILKHRRKVDMLYKKLYEYISPSHNDIPDGLYEQSLREQLPSYDEVRRDGYLLRATYNAIIYYMKSKDIYSAAMREINRRKQRMPRGHAEENNSNSSINEHLQYYQKIGLLCMTLDNAKLNTILKAVEKIAEVTA